MSDEPMRHCLLCGSPIARRPQDKPAVYAVRRFCSRLCAARFRHSPAYVGPHYYGPDTRTCDRCGQEYHRKPGESKAHFAARHYCGRECAGVGDSPPPLCDCGALATTTVHFVQLTSIGTPYTASLDLCEACAADVYGGSPTPHTITDPSPSFGWTTGRQTYHHPAHLIGHRAHHE